jgi:hypothetical protein
MSEPVADFKAFSYNALSTQLAYRRDRRHAIFAWCSSILVASIGGIVAFAKKPGALNLYQQCIITATIVILAAFTIRWIYHHWNLEKRLEGQLDKIDKDLRIETSDPKKHFIDWAQTLAVLGLAGTVLVATWVPQIP